MFGSVGDVPRSIERFPVHVLIRINTIFGPPEQLLLLNDLKLIPLPIEFEVDIALRQALLLRLRVELQVHLQFQFLDRAFIAHFGRRCNVVCV